MPIRVDLLPLEPNLPGQARLSIKKWQGGSAQLEFSIQRNQDQFFLHGGQQWSSTEFWFQIASLTPNADGTGLETLVGAELVDPVLEGSGSSKFQIVLHDRADGLRDRGVVQPGAGLLPSTAGGETRSSYGSAALSTPTPAPVAPEPEPAVEIPDEPELALPVADPLIERPAVTPPAPVRKNKWLLPLLILLLLIAAATGWWWFNRKAEAPAPVVVAPPATTTPGAGACTAESMASETELGFVQSCIKQAPDSAALLQIIQQAKASKHCGIAQRLYANRSQAGDVTIATAYAHEYDPKFHQANDCFAEPDAATAAYWYESILSVQPDNAEAKQRFQELKP